MLTYSFANQILNHMCGKISSVNIGNEIKIGLSSTTPNRGGTGYTEPGVGTGYERVTLGNTGQSLSQAMGSADEGVITNTKNIFFPRALTAYPAPITNFLVFGATTLIAYGSLQNNLIVGIDTVPLIEIGDLVISIDEVEGE